MIAVPDVVEDVVQEVQNMEAAAFRRRHTTLLGFESSIFLVGANRL